MLKFLFLIISILLTFSGFSQTNWAIQNENGEELLLTIQINKENNTFEAHTRKEALREMAGTFTYMLAKTAGKLKFPEIVHSSGKLHMQGDTTFYNGSFDYLDKSFPLKAKSWQNSFLGELTDNKNRPHALIGTKVATDKPLHNYPAIIKSAFSLTEKYCSDRSLYKSAEWLAFKSKVAEVQDKIADDYELGAVIFWHGKKIPINNYEIKKISKRENDSKPQREVKIKEAKLNTGYLDLSYLPADKENMDQLFSDMVKKELNTLILDGRGRKNLQLGQAALLAEHLTTKPADWGVYLTRQWLDGNITVPNCTQYIKMVKNAVQITENTPIYQENGRYLKPVPAPVVFKGKVYLLIDQRTSKIAEALAIWLKNDKLGTLVGQKSAGLPMVVENITIENQYRISIPTAQFFDKTGKSWLGIGVEPDLPVTGDALGAVLK